jgi:hypothetical protein
MSRYRINYKGCEVLLRCTNSYELQVRDDRSIQGALFWHMLERVEENHKDSNGNSGYGSPANMKIVQSAVSCPFFSAKCIKKRHLKYSSHTFYRTLSSNSTITC